MISLRYHVVSIAAVFLALALGVVLGSTALSGTLLSGLSGQREQLGDRVAQLEQERNAANARLQGADRFAADIGPLAVRQRLRGHSVAVLSTADVSATDRRATEQLINSAGGSLSADVRLTSAFTDRNDADRLRDLITRMIPAGAKLPAVSDPGTLAGGLFGSLLTLDGKGKPQATNNEIDAAFAGLTEGGFLQPGDTPKPAQLVLVLTGGREHGDSPGDAALTVANLAAQLDRACSGAVLAGATGSADGDGAVGVSRADRAAGQILSTVDNTDTAQGRVAVVLALAGQLDGTAGRYGTAGNAESPATDNR